MESLPENRERLQRSLLVLLLAFYYDASISGITKRSHIFVVTLSKKVVNLFTRCRNLSIPASKVKSNP